MVPHSLIEMASYLAPGGTAVGKSEFGTLPKYRSMELMQGHFSDSRSVAHLLWGLCVRPLQKGAMRTLGNDLLMVKRLVLWYVSAVAGRGPPEPLTPSLVEQGDSLYHSQGPKGAQQGTGGRGKRRDHNSFKTFYCHSVRHWKASQS